jgi:hypothetical protein
VSCFGCSTTSRRFVWRVGLWKNSIRCWSRSQRSRMRMGSFFFCPGCRRSCDMARMEGKEEREGEGERVICGFCAGSSGHGVTCSRCERSSKSSYAGLNEIWAAALAKWNLSLVTMSFFYNHSLHFVVRSGRDRVLGLSMLSLTFVEDSKQVSTIRST